MNQAKYASVQMAFTRIISHDDYPSGLQENGFNVLSAIPRYKLFLRTSTRDMDVCFEFYQQCCYNGTCFANYPIHYGKLRGINKTLENQTCKIYSFFIHLTVPCPVSDVGHLSHLTCEGIRRFRTLSSDDSIRIIQICPMVQLAGTSSCKPKVAGSEPVGHEKIFHGIKPVTVLLDGWGL